MMMMEMETGNWFLRVAVHDGVHETPDSVPRDPFDPTMG